MIAELFSSFPLLILVVATIINLFFVYFIIRANPKSATNRTFSLLGIALSLWLIAIYLAPDATLAPYGLLLARLTLFFVTPVNVLFFLFAWIFPLAEFRMSKVWLSLLMLGMVLVMAVSLSPWGLKGAQALGGGQEQAVPAAGFAAFGIFSVLLNIGAIYVFIRRLRKTAGEEHEQIRFVAIGVAVMFGFIILTIFLPIVFFHNSNFIPLAPVYALIFLAFTGYAIVKHHLFDLKVIATEAFTGVLCAALFAKLWIDTLPSARAEDAVIFLASLVLGIFLVRSVRAEVRQREELQRLNARLETANAELEKLNRFKNELLSLASHQIRSPLAAIKGFVSLVMDGSYGAVDPKASEALGKVKRSADELISLINTLLDFRRVEEGKMEYQFAPCDLRALVNETVEGLQPLAGEKKLALTFADPGKEVMVSADAEKLKQVIQNLVDNAIKYTPSGFVKISLKADGNKAVVQVADSGLGIPKALTPYLFEEFTRDDRVKKDIRGTGLGLYIAKNIVEAHKGSIVAESEGEGKGSTFTIALPAAEK